MFAIRRSLQRAFGMGLLAAGLWLPLAASAEVSDDCSAWTLLPDFRCEERTARPDNTFNVMGMPFLFEDPYITSGLNLVWVWHSFPADSPLGGLPAALGGPEDDDGGHLNLLALQIRLAITDRLAFIATKDGATFQRPGNPALPDFDGFYDMTLGFKYAAIDDRENDFILSPAVRYEIPLGNEALFQGYGKGVFIVSGSWAWGMERIGLENANFVGSLGGQIPVDMDANSTSMFYNLHFDYGVELGFETVPFIVPFLELNGLYYTSGGDGTNPVHLSALGQAALGAPTAPVGALEAAYGYSFEGVDVANLGARGIAGSSIVVLGGGLRVPTKWGVSFGAMFEGAISGQKDVYDKRFTAMITWEL